MCLYKCYEATYTSLKKINVPNNTKSLAQNNEDCEHNVDIFVLTTTGDKALETVHTKIMWLKL